MNFFKNELLVYILNESCFASVPPDVREDATRENQSWGAIQEKRERKVGEKSLDPWALASLSPHRDSPHPDWSPHALCSVRIGLGGASLTGEAQPTRSQGHETQ